MSLNITHYHKLRKGKVTKSAIWERIDHYRIVSGKSLAEISEAIGVGVSMLMMVKSGKRSLSSKAVYRLEQAEAAVGIQLPPKKEFIVHESRPSYAAKKRDKEIHSILQEMDQLKARLEKLLQPGGDE